MLLIDNYDSFTYNLYQQLASLGAEVQVVANDKVSLDEVKNINPDEIVISPGPKRPEDSGISLEVIKSLYKTVPILGVCLGHQAIGHIFGVKTIHAKEVLHGKTSSLRHTGTGLFTGVSNLVQVTRYHSLALASVPEDFALTAWTQDREIMGIQHNVYPVYGIQFHPESFLTEEGDKIIRNFLDASRVL